MLGNKSVFKILKYSHRHYHLSTPNPEIQNPECSKIQNFLSQVGTQKVLNFRAFQISRLGMAKVYLESFFTSHVSSCCHTETLCCHCLWESLLRGGAPVSHGQWLGCFRIKGWPMKGRKRDRSKGMSQKSSSSLTGRMVINSTVVETGWELSWGWRRACVYSLHEFATEMTN